MTDKPCPQIDTSVPHSARIWNYWLGGKDHYPADRQAGDAYREVFPGIEHLARTARYFLARVVRYLVAEAGIRQLLDIGTGLPTVDNTHQVAQRAAPDAKIVYVDNDPMVLTHARALLTSTPEGVCEYIDADLRDPQKILRKAAKTLDFGAPAALLLMGIMGHLPDHQAYPVVSQFAAALPPGSFLALYDGASTSQAFTKAQDAYNRTGADPYYLRAPEQITRFFDGLTLVEPGVVACSWWRPEDTPFGPPGKSHCYGGVART
jgi:O-methyltransferase involved in polyketide biosynthesis